MHPLRPHIRGRFFIAILQSGMVYFPASVPNRCETTAPSNTLYVSKWSLPLNTFLNCISVGAGGLIGSVLRYLLSLLPIQHSSGFPLITLGINVLGAFLIGLIVAFAGKSASLDPRTVLFLQVGLCGGFTTFSSFALETHTLLQGGKLLVALGYICLSVVLCVGATALSNVLAK